MPCPFCQIVDGGGAASIIYSDDLVLAFLDTRPVNEGHVLVVPRQHRRLLSELDEHSVSQIWRVGVWLAGGLRRCGLRCEGVNLVLNDGEAALQSVPHVHLHVLPRFTGDGFGFRFPDGYGGAASREALDILAARLASLLESAGPSPGLTGVGSGLDWRSAGRPPPWEPRFPSQPRSLRAQVEDRLGARTELALQAQAPAHQLGEAA